jgi:hypothetical protein
MNFSLGFRDAPEHGDGFLFHPRGEFAAGDQLFDPGEIPLLVMRMVVVVAVLMQMPVLVWMRMTVCVCVIMRAVDIKLHARYGRLFLARNVEMVAVQLEFFQLAFELVRVQAKVEKRAEEHVTRDAAEKVEVKDFHDLEMRALIWLAA